MIAFFAKIFGFILNFIYEIVNNYGIAIILFSILVKLLMLPISIKQQKTMKKSVKVQSKMKEIQLKYKNNPEKLNEATLELYRTENMSPFSGCLSAIVQIILLFAVFYLVRSPLTYMKKVDATVIDKYSNIMKQNEMFSDSAYPEIEIIREIENIRKLKINENEKNAENKDTENDVQAGENKNSQINDEELDSMQINMEFFGLNLAQVPTKSSDWKAYIIPVLYVAISIISMKITNPTSSNAKPQPVENKEEKALLKPEEEFDPMAQMNKNMNLLFPIMYISIALIAPLGLALYWLMNSLLMIVEKKLLNKLIKEEEE